jgi:hypothetical protein
VLADDIGMSDIDGRHLRGWLDLLIPPGLAAAPRWALVVLDRGAPIHAVRGGEGALEIESIRLGGTGRAELRALRRRLGVDVLAVLERDALARLSAAAEAELRLADHYTRQSLVWLEALRGELREGVWLDPPVADLIPPLSSDALERTFDLLVPDATAMVAYVVADDRRELAASVIAVKRGGRLSEVSSHRAIADRLPEASLARSWTTQYRRANALIGERFADVSVGLYAERGAIRRILAGPADQLSREMANKRLVIDPMPRWLAALIGGANAAVIAGRGARRLGALLPESARRAAGRIAAETQRRARASGAHPWQVLGFDPLELWRKVRGYYQ